MRPAVVWLHRSDRAIAGRLAAALDGLLHGPEGDGAGADVVFARLVPHLRELFWSGTPILALCASGIVVRALGALLGDKREEPPVVVVERSGRFVVPLLGAHRGGLALARRAAQALGAEVVASTASEARFGVALDAPPDGWRIGSGAKPEDFVGRLLRGCRLRLVDETGCGEWLRDSGLPWDEGGELELRISVRAQEPRQDVLVYHPPLLALGVGCVRGASLDALQSSVERALSEAGLAREAVALVATIDLKEAEPAVCELAALLGVPVRLFSADELQALEPRLKHPSQAVRRAVGVAGVAEAAALAAAGPEAKLILPKRIGPGVTLAVARARRPIDPSRVGRARGELRVVGIGPGDPAAITRSALRALAEAEVIVGYRGYLDRLGRLAGGRVLRPFAIGEEMERCRAALDEAAAGRRVALVSSGDPGIYAMASPLFELLDREGEARSAWRRLRIEVVPGISAFQEAAARTGALLGHDFCLISLSDLLTPKEHILARVRAAAATDLLLALYNPASRRRRRLLQEVHRELLAQRPGDTPAVLARKLGQPGEECAVTTLAALPLARLDMHSLLLIGNRHSRMVRMADGSLRLYTPRGYRAS